MNRVLFSLVFAVSALMLGGSHAQAAGPSESYSLYCKSNCGSIANGITITGTLDTSAYAPGSPIYLTATALSDDNPLSFTPIARGTVSGQTQSANAFSDGPYTQAQMQAGVTRTILIGTAPSAAGSYTVSTYYSSGGYSYATGSLSFTVNPFCEVIYQTSPDTITWDTVWDTLLTPGQSSSPPVPQDSKHMLTCTSSGTTCTITGTSGSANYVAHCGTVAPPTNTNSAACSALSAPATLQAGQSFPASITMTNIGNTVWTSTNNYMLGSQNPQDNTTWGLNRVALPSSVSPGGSATFSGTLNAPTTPGTYSFAWQMLQEYVAWFGGTCSQTIQVCGADAPYTETNATTIANYCSAQGVTCPAGQQYVSSISCNTGAAGTWTPYGSACTAPNCTGCGCVSPSSTLSVNSLGSSGVVITSSTGHGGTTNYTKAIAAGTSISLTAPSTAGGNNFSNWTGCTSVSGTTCTGTMPASNTTVTVNYTAPSLPDLTAAGMNQSTATPGKETTLSATISNIGASSTGTSFPNFIQVATAVGGGGTLTNLTSTAMSALVAGGTNTTSQSYIFPAAGTYSARACANTTNNSTFAVTESNYGNNCGAWTPITVTSSVTAPIVTTSAVTSITQTSARSGGTINANGGSTVTVSGIVWGTSANPTTASNAGKTTDGWAVGGPWTDSITGLTAGTTYHVRAYATNSAGTSYGADVPFTTTASTGVGGCSATTFGNCSLSATASGGTSGSCTSGYSGSCSYTCTNGAWSQNSNSCTSTSVLSCSATYADTVVIGTTGDARAVTWGSGPYTDDSDLGYAAVHAGLISAGQSATIHRTALGTIASFIGSTRNGVTTASYGTFCGVSLSIAPAAPTGPATASLSASPSSISRGLSSTLTWDSKNATSCTSAGGFSTGGATSGSVTVSPLSTSTYSVTCTGPLGTSAPANVTVTVIDPTLAITAYPPRVRSGSQSVVSWNATGVKSCTITKNGSDWKSGTADSQHVYAGSVTDTIVSRTKYLLSCTDVTGAPWPASAAVTVNILTNFLEF